MREGNYPIRAQIMLTPLDSVEGISLVCLRRVGAMDSMRLVLNLPPATANTYIAAGSPIKVRWTGADSGDTDEFIGYVHSYRPTNVEYLERTLIVAVGLAYPMVNESGRSYYNMSIHNVAEDISDDYRIDLDADPHFLVQDQILQQDDSDWSFLRRLADRWGYVMYIDGATLVFRLLKNVVRENGRFAKFLRSADMPSTFGTDLYSFEPSFSMTGINPMARSVGQGVQPVASQRFVWEQQEGNNIFQQVSTVSVQHELEGEMTQVAAEATDLFPYTASATMIHPTGCKAMDAYRIQHQDKTMTWSVHSVKHIIADGKYIADLVLGSDGSDYGDPLGPSRGMDVPILLSRNRRLQRAAPILTRSRPYFSGAGANAVVSEERWKARVRQKEAWG